MANITGKSIFKYVLTPQVVPRFKELFATGFSYVPYFVALVYQIVRLLPNNHPYLNPRNMGQYGVRHVIAEAANNLTVSRENIDQIILFFMILAGLVLIALQVGLLVFGVVVQPAMASGFLNLDSYFQSLLGDNRNYFSLPPEMASNDIAYMMLDLVFGVPHIFESCISTQGIAATESMGGIANSPAGAACLDSNGAPILNSAGNWVLSHLGFPFPAHYGLHALFRFYSLGLLIVAALIISYFIITVVAETAQTGTPFGKRFNKVWAPLRLVVAVGLLIPVGYGLNSSQYIVLYAAKFGSAFASNGWSTFMATLNSSSQGSWQSAANSILKDQPKQHPMASAESLAATPQIPDFSALLQFLYAARVCAEGQYYETENVPPPRQPTKIGMYLVKDNFSGATSHLRVEDITDIADNLTTRRNRVTSFGTLGGMTPYEDLVEFANGAHQVTIRFGIHDERSNSEYRGNVEPTCGEMVFSLANSQGGSSLNSETHKGAEIMQRGYWALLNILWYELLYLDPVTTEPYAYNENKIAFPPRSDQQSTPIFLPGSETASDLNSFAKMFLNAVLVDPSKNVTYGGGSFGIKPNTIPGITEAAVNAQNESAAYNIDEVLVSKGWGGAAIWYNKIAEINGVLVTATGNYPTPVRWPMRMEDVYNQKKAVDNTVDMSTRFQPIIAGDKNAVVYDSASNEYYQAQALWSAYDYWDKNNLGRGSEVKPTGNLIEDAINFLFGVEGLFNLRDNKGTHPLAMMVGLGRSLVQAGMNNLTVMMGGGAIMGVLGAKAPASVAIGIGSTLSTIALTLGFILFYVVPFMPFIYFFFALGGWVKGIFEAMVGAPLWALAHIRIDGNGLPGQAAMGGYYLIFEIFLRPILCVFGLIASISIFSAMVNTLHEVWELVTANAGGSNANTPENLNLKQFLDLNSEQQRDYIRSPVDEFFYTIMYAVVVYMIGMSSFKLIDLIPNNILRWMGQSVSTFNDAREDAAQQLQGSTYVGAQQAISGIGGQAEGLAKTVAGVK